MKKLLTSVVLVLMVASSVVFLTSCGAKETMVNVDGFYVKNILFMFSEEALADICDGKITKNEAAKALVATNNDTGAERQVWGIGGVYEEISNALENLTGQSALDIFYEYIDRYNDDPGMFSPDNTKGYLIPLGRSAMVWEFELLARDLFDSEDPNSSVGNAFSSYGEDLDGELISNKHLAFAVTDFGVHIAIISGLSTR